MGKEKNALRMCSANETKRNEPRAYEFFKTKLFRVQQIFFRYLGKSIRSTMVVPRLSIHLDGRRNHDSPGTDLTSTGKQKTSGRTIFSRHKSGEEGRKVGPITSVQVFSRTKGGGKKERTWKVARNSEARPDASGFRK